MTLRYGLLCLFLLVLVGFAGDWSQFRGPNGSGIADTAGVPLEFGPGMNVVWRTPAPSGHSSPVLTANRIFISGFLSRRRGTYLDMLHGNWTLEPKLEVLCFDRSNGKLLW